MYFESNITSVSWFSWETIVVYTCGAVAQMVERSLSMWEVRGSMPRSSSILFRIYLVVDNRVANGRCVHFVSFSIAPFEIYIIVFNRPNLQYKNSKTNKAPGGVEPSTFCLLGRRSNQLSYRADINVGGHFFLQPNMHSFSEAKTTQKRKIRIPGSR